MPTHRQRFTGAVEEHFPEPPIARLLYPGDVIEYDADQPVQHARLEDAEQPDGWERFPHHVEGFSAVYRPAQPSEAEPPKSRRKTAAETASTDKEE